MNRRMLRVATVLAVLTLGTPAAMAGPSRGFNDEYVYATTRGLNNTDMHPALKVTLLPVTVVLDTAFLPFALIAGVVT